MTRSAAAQAAPSAHQQDAANAPLRSTTSAPTQTTETPTSEACARRATGTAQRYKGSPHEVTARPASVQPDDTPDCVMHDHARRCNKGGGQPPCWAGLKIGEIAFQARYGS